PRSVGEPGDPARRRPGCPEHRPARPARRGPGRRPERRAARARRGRRDRRDGRRAPALHGEAVAVRGGPLAMTTIVLALATLIAAAIINRACGGGYFGIRFDRARPDKLPGRALYPGT